MNGSHRGPAIVAVTALLVAGGLADRVAHRSTGTRVTAGADVPTAARASARSSTWYCTGGTSAPAGVADATVVVANAGDRPLKGDVTVTPVQGDARRLPLTVGPAGRATVHLGDAVRAPYVSAVVELDGGQAVVEEVGRGPLGDSVSACASSASAHWYFADGDTSKDATEILAVFNPFPEDAVVDFVFATEEGRLTPQALTGMVVGGERMAAVNVGDFVHRHPAVATTVTARAGRLVATRLQTFDGSAGRKGASLALGAAGTATQWHFPEGMVGDGLVERYQVFNPTTQEARAEIALALDQGAAEPIQLTVPPEARVTVVANEQTRIPKGVAHAATVRSTNGVAVVAERTIDAAPPSKRLGTARTVGSPVAARRWSLAAGEASKSVDEWLALYNPGPRPSVVSVVLLADGDRLPVEGLEGLRLQPGQRASLRLGDHLDRPATPSLVEATAPVVVERDLYRTGGLGAAMVLGIPLR